MPKLVEGSLIATGKKFAIIAARWNGAFAERLIEGALESLRLHGAADEDVTVYRCPGCFELGQVAGKVAQVGGHDAIVCLGVLIRGATPHFDYIAGKATADIGSVGLEHGIPVSYGVLTCDTQDQALERSGSKVGNKGEEAVLAVIEMVNLYAEIENR